MQVKLVYYLLFTMMKVATTFEIFKISILESSIFSDPNHRI